MQVKEPSKPIPDSSESAESKKEKGNPADIEEDSGDFWDYGS
jgi:hypothetical protein